MSLHAPIDIMILLPIKKMLRLMGKRALWIAWILIAVAGIDPVRAADPTVTPPPTVPVALAVTGRVIAGTAGISVPTGLSLTLNVAHPDTPGGLPSKTQTWNAPLAPDNTFRFDNIPAFSGDLAFVTTTFQNVVQGSPIMSVTSAQPGLSALVTLYAITNDPGVITLSRIQHILDFKIASFMQVVATYDYKNTSDRLYLSDNKTDQGQPYSVTIPLPIGARAIAFNALPADRFALGGDANARIVQDTTPVIPGEVHEIVFSYQLPYDDGAPIDQDYPYQTLALEVLIPDDSRVTLSSDAFTVSPNTTLNPDRPYTQYGLKAPIQAGGRLVYMLNGVAQMLPTANPQASSRARGPQFGDILIVAVIFLVILGVVAVVGWRTWRGERRARRRS